MVYLSSLRWVMMRGDIEVINSQDNYKCLSDKPYKAGSWVSGGGYRFKSRTFSGMTDECGKLILSAITVTDAAIAKMMNN